MILTIAAVDIVTIRAGKVLIAIVGSRITTIEVAAWAAAVPLVEGWA